MTRQRPRRVPSGRPQEVGDVRTMQRAATFAVLGVGLGSIVVTGASAGTNIVAKDFTLSRILVGPPYADQVQGDVATDQTLTVNIMIEDINDPAAQNGRVDIAVDLSEVASTVDIVGLTPDCAPPTTDTVECHIQLPDLAPPPPVAVPIEAIKLRARAGSPVGSAGAIYLDWAFNGAPAPTMATINVQIVPAATPTDPPTTNPPPTTPAPTNPPPTTASTHPTTPAVIKPRPTGTTPRMTSSPSPSPTPGVTMTPDPTSAPNLDSVDPLAGPAVVPIPIATPPAYAPARRSPALILSLGTAAGGLLIALVYAIVSLRKATRS